MNELERLVADDRAVRNAARAVFNARKLQVEAALADKPVGTRVSDEARERAKTVAGDAATIARDNVAVVAGTVLLLAAWLFRKPLADWVNMLFQRDEPGELAEHWQRFQDWIKSIPEKG